MSDPATAIFSCAQPLSITIPFVYRKRLTACISEHAVAAGCLLCRSLATLRRSQLLRDLLITSGGVAGSNSRLWRSQARNFREPKRFLHLFFCAIAQYLSFLPAILRGLLQELRRSLR